MSPRREGLHGAGMVSGLRSGAVHVSAGPWWNPDLSIGCAVGAWDAKNASSLANSYIDLTGNGNNMTLGVAPAWAFGTGWTFDGATQWLNSNIIPVCGSYSLYLRYTNRTGGSYMFATTSGAGKYFGLIHTTNPGYMDGVVPAYQAPALVSGNLGVDNLTGYRNGVADLALAANAGASAALYIGCRNVAGVPQQFAAFTAVAAVVYSCHLSVPQRVALVGAMAAL